MVGSSSTSTLAGRVNRRASSRRFRSPPDSALHRRARPLGREEEIAQVAVDVARPAVDGHHVVAVADRVEHGPVGVELLALLVVVGDLHVGAAPDLARIRLQLAEQQPQQRRLAGAVGADEPDAVAAHDAGRERRRPPVRRRTPWRPASASNTVLARRVGRLDLQPHGRRPASRRLARSSRMAAARGTRPSLRVRRALTPCRSQASSSASSLVELLLVRALRWPATASFFSQEGGVVARPRRQPAAVELDHARREPSGGRRGRG